jgi:phosphonate transport system substrate-binding protein
MPGKLLAALIAIFAAAMPAMSSQQKPVADASITMGSVAMDIPVEMIKRMSVLTNYLALHTGLNIRFRPSPNLGSAVEELGSNQTQIAYLTPVAYVDARQKYGMIPLVAPTIQGRPHFSLVIGARAGSNIRNPSDLKGKRFAFGDEKALLQKAAVASMGLNTTDFSQFAYLKHYDNIAKAILAGDFEGGILKDSVAEDFKDKGIVVIASTPPLPSYIFAVHPSMPVSVRNKLRDAFLALKKDTPIGTATLEAFDSSYDGFVVIQDSAYDPVRKLIQPFQK